MRKYLQLIRLHHWVKNSLIAIVFLFNPSAWIFDNIIQLLLLIFCWGLIASAGYIINDILDAENDKQHPDKKHRPIASGAVSKQLGYTIATVFTLVALGSVYFLQLSSFYMLLCYFILNVAYSMYLKTVRYIDLIILTSFYMLRIMIGANLFGLPITNWFFVTSFFGLLAVSIKKREMETYRLKENQNTRRSYTIQDSTMLSTLSYTSAFVSLIFLNLHTILYLRLNNLYLLLTINAAALYVILTFLDKESISDDVVKTFLKRPAFYLIAIALVVIYVYIVTSGAQ